MKGLIHKSKGFTLIELMVVMTILSVLAGIVVPAVTGTTTIGKGTALTSDIVTVQQAVDRFAGDNPVGTDKGWPVNGGELPDIESGGSVPLDWGAYFVDNKANVAKVFLIDYLRGSASHSGATRSKGSITPDTKLAGQIKPIEVTDADYGKLTDGNVTVTIATTRTGGKITDVTITRTASTGSKWPDNNTNTVGSTNIAKDITTTGAEVYPVWRVDKYGKVLVVMSDSEY